MSAGPLWLQSPPRSLFFTGKGGVGKTSTACAAALELAARERRVLLVSTDPASNLDEVLATPLNGTPTPVAGIEGLSALNLDPERAAREYRERIVGPFRKSLPAAAVASIEEQLSGACTTEIAAFDEFSKLLADPAATREFDHVVFDTAPTGHTLRLLELPSAWSGFIASNAGGTSCLGPLSGLSAQKSLYENAMRRLSSAEDSLFVLVARPEQAALVEAERTRVELGALSILNLALVVNGVFRAADRRDAPARALEDRGAAALAAMPAALAALPRTNSPLLSYPLLGAQALGTLLNPRAPRPAPASGGVEALPPGESESFEALLDGIAASGRGVLMLMGKGGVGKTRLAVAAALGLARRGHRVNLTTTDPAAHLEAALAGRTEPGLRASRIDPELETRLYREGVLAAAGAGLDAKGRALLEEELRSPCTEEIAVFQAFARTVDEAERGFVVIDTAPTGHTLLLLDAAEAYHREVSKSMGEVPVAVRKLLPRLRDPGFTRVLLVALPESTPVHEAEALQADLKRAGIDAYGWIVNQSWTPVETGDPVLRERRVHERKHLARVRELSPRVAVVAWTAEEAGALLEEPA